MGEFTSIKDIHKAYAEKKLSPIELTKSYILKIKKNKLNAYLSTCEDRAINQAEAQTKQLSKIGKNIFEQQPLFGVPFGIKDVLVIEGIKTTCGSKMLENYNPPYTATAARLLENAGAICLGKLNMDEFAMGSSNENSAYGPVLHPIHNDRVPGGSSGGSASAVKADLCLAALGTDTGGSIRQPASFCGVVGVKPTYGQVSRYGLVAFASSLDQIGPLTNNVEDSARILDVIMEHDKKDSTSVNQNFGVKIYPTLADKFDLSKLKIGVFKDSFSEGVDNDVRINFEKTLKWYESKGARLISVSLPHSKYSIAVYYVIAVCEASSNLARFDGVRFGVRNEIADNAQNLTDFYKKVRSNFGSEVKRRIMLGTFCLSSGYYDAYYKKACLVRRLIQNDYLELFKSVDIIASPVAPTTAFKLGEKKDDPLKMYLSDIFTIPASLSGLPAMSLPCGYDAQGLPIGMQFVAPAFCEDKMLKIAHAFEKDGAK